MSLLSSIVFLLLLLLLVVSFLYRPNSPSLLPTTGHRPLTTVTLRHAQLHIRTTAWNRTHDVLSMSLRRRDNTVTRTALTRFYNLGSIAGVLGMLGAFVLLSWMFVTTTRNAFVSRHAGYVKRDLDVPFKPVLKPIIPGVTVPLGHLPIILACVVLNQVFHEAGHFIAGALERATLQSLTFNLVIILPTFSTDLSAPALAELSPSARVRIITAGAWHNLVLFVVLMVLGLVFRVDINGGWLGWKGNDVSAWGRVVISVDSDSPLVAHLPPGTLITALDDTLLSSGPPDPWISYLTSTESTTETDGWCVSRTWYLVQPQTCCAPTSGPEPPSTSLSCFTSVDSPREDWRCVDPVPILTRPDDGTIGRCALQSQCPDTALCVQPRRDAKLLRLTVLMPGHWERQQFEPSRVGLEEVILWSGLRREVYEQVEVSKYTPLTGFNFTAIWGIARIFVMYLKLAALSLYLFNLLPMPMLDGSHLMVVLLAVFPSGDQGVDLDLEEGPAQSHGRFGAPRDRWNGNRSRGLRWKSVIQRAAEGTTTGMFLVCLALGTWNSFR